LGVLGAEDKLLETQITNTEGYVVFRNVMSGFYFLRPNMMTNFVPTTPTTQALTLKGDVQGAALEWTFGLAPRAQMPARIFLPAISR
jgi:hypothetical protein